MELYQINSGYFKLDGGAMFGVVPKQMWQKLNKPDDNNMCTWAMRCLLVKDGDRIILFDTGMGDKQDDKFKGHFEPHGPYSLVSSIREAGFEPEEITDVFLTHLHFDHVGGALVRNADDKIVPQFRNAKYWSSRTHLESALAPNFRERASFLKENIVPLIEAKVLHFVSEEDGVHFNDNITIDFYHGHTTSMMVPTIHIPDGKKVIYPADLLPSTGHVRMPYVMSYDINPLQTLKEKKKFYEKILDKNTYLFFEHDKEVALGQLARNERGRYSISTDFDIKDVLT